MSEWPASPIIYEVNTWVWLQELSERFGYPVTLGTVPEEAIEEVIQWNPDAVWLMGVWERSPKGREIAREHPDLQKEFHRVLPDFRPEDVVGSPYAIYRYAVDPHYDGAEGLAAFRARLAESDIKLILDFVPNDVAIDHPWTTEHPEYLMQGTEEDLEKHPGIYFRSGDYIFAHGRDPYYPAWTDTVQVNINNYAAREALAETAEVIAEVCDGVRCDMAMLLVQEVFERTWGEQEASVSEFWPELIGKVKQSAPNFLFVAEVYWEMEAKLHELGFNYCYDKALYDKIREEGPTTVRDHLRANVMYQKKLVRFVENHDEPRAADALGWRRSMVGAVLTSTLPGATLFYEGQFEGRRVKIPVQLGRRPDEPVDEDIRQLYRSLTRELSRPIYHRGEWRLLEALPSWENGETHDNIIAFQWQDGYDYSVIVVNLSFERSDAYIRLERDGLSHRVWEIWDVANNKRYTRDGGYLEKSGLYVDLPPFGCHLMVFQK